MSTQEGNWWSGRAVSDLGNEIHQFASALQHRALGWTTKLPVTDPNPSEVGKNIPTLELHLCRCGGAHLFPLSPALRTHRPDSKLPEEGLRCPHGSSTPPLPAAACPLLEDLPPLFSAWIYTIWPFLFLILRWLLFVILASSFHCQVPPSRSSSCFSVLVPVLLYLYPNLVFLMLAILALSTGVPWHEWLHSPASPSVDQLSLAGFCLPYSLPRHNDLTSTSVPLPVSSSSHHTHQRAGDKLTSPPPVAAQPFHHPSVPLVHQRAAVFLSIFTLAAAHITGASGWAVFTAICTSGKIFMWI